MNLGDGPVSIGILCIAAVGKPHQNTRIHEAGH
jgi:hypothetical protein